MNNGYVLSSPVVSDSATQWTVAHQVPLSMSFSRQEYWSGLPFPPPEDLPDPGIESMSSASPALKVGSLPAEPSGPGTSTLLHVSNVHFLCLINSPLCVCVCAYISPSGLMCYLRPLFSY